MFDAYSPPSFPWVREAALEARKGQPPRETARHQEATQSSSTLRFLAAEVVTRAECRLIGIARRSCSSTSRRGPTFAPRPGERLEGARSRIDCFTCRQETTFHGA
jgi:hypothetical protein